MKISLIRRLLFVWFTVLYVTTATEARILDPDLNCAVALTGGDEVAKRAYFESGGTDFAFTLERGPSEKNYFLRVNQNQSHTVINSGHHAHLITAFPAGNMSGAMFPDGEIEWALIQNPQAIAGEAGEFGVRLEASAPNHQIHLRNVIVGSTRDVRDFEHAGQEFADAKVHPRRLGPSEVLFERERLDKQGRYALKITVHDGTISLEKGIVLQSHAGPLRFRVDILNSETPLRPMPITQIFNHHVRQRMSVADIESALYLTTADKILAGSWRYQTFFGRDPKLTQLYAADYLEPEVMEAELAAVFSRLDPSGDAAHEENLGDSATRQNLAEGRGPVSTPVLDYKMVDTVFLVAAHLKAYLKKVTPERAALFLRGSTPTGRKFTAALRANLELVIRRAHPFELNPIYQNLISFKDHSVVGDWRDSGNGHGALTDAESLANPHLDRTLTGGRYSFGVNVALVPAALKIAHEVFADPQLGVLDLQRAAAAESAWRVWQGHARPLFTVVVSSEVATARAIIQAQDLGIPSPAPLKTPLRFAALSLDRLGHPIEAIHSDEGFDLLLNWPNEDVLNDVAESLLRPSAYGLNQPVGMPIVNAFLIKDPVMRRRFNPDEYHGAIWGCEMAKMERGLARQINRNDLSTETHAHLVKAHRHLWQILAATKVHHKEELWKWKVEGTETKYAAFAEANALQTWNQVLSLLQNPYEQE